LELFTVVTDAAFDLVLFKVFRAKFKSDWSSSYFPIVEFKAWVVVVTVINNTSDSSIFQFLKQFFRFR